MFFLFFSFLFEWFQKRINRSVEVGPLMQTLLPAQLSFLVKIHDASMDRLSDCHLVHRRSKAKGAKFPVDKARKLEIDEQTDRPTDRQTDQLGS